jgi:hypothetical protein
MKTLIFCTAYANSEEAWDTRYARWLRGITKSNIKYNQVLLVDDGSESSPNWPSLDVIEEGSEVQSDEEIVLYKFRSRLGRLGTFDFPGWYRSFCFAAEYAERGGFSKAVHVESDAFVISERLVNYINGLEDGWTSMWIHRWSMAESGVQIIAGASMATWKEFSCVPYSTRAGHIFEHYIPFTANAKQFVGDRYGEFSTSIPRDADWAMQTSNMADNELWWLTGTTSSSDDVGDPIGDHTKFILTHWQACVGAKSFVTLRGAMVDSSNWVVYHEGRAIVPWVAHMIHINREQRNGFKWSPGSSIEKSILNETDRVSLKKALLVGGNDDIYHYTIDYLANTLHPELTDPKRGPIPLLVDARLKWQRELVDCYTLGAPAVIQSKADVVFQVDELIIPHKYFDYSGRNIVSEWNSRVRQRLAHIEPVAHAPDRIYVSRSRARSRRVGNEIELQTALNRLGFATVYPEELTVCEQVQMFKSARVVVGPTGAAFTNVAYAAPGAILVEFMPEDSWMPRRIEFLMQASSVRYSNLKCPGKFEDRYFTVDVSRLIVHLHELGIR